MTREDVIKLFPEATDEQVTKLLNRNNEEVAGEKRKVDKYKTDLEKMKTDAEAAAELRARVEELENEKLTEEERQKKAKEAIEKELSDKMAAIEKDNAELKAQLTSERIRAYAGSKNLTGEHIDNVLKSFGGSYDLAVAAIDSMAQLITDRESAAALAKEQEIAKASGNPIGQKSGDNGDGKSSAVRLVERHFSSPKTNNDILSHYLNGGN